LDAKTLRAAVLLAVGYNLLCATLGLTPAPSDGDGSLVREVLAK
jgi:hypothetical protein